MKKKVLFSIVAVALFAVAMILKVETSNNCSELAIKNIEAIAGGEDSIMEDPGDGGGNCNDVILCVYDMSETCYICEDGETIVFPNYEEEAWE
jgi:hypothetical protein